MVLVLVLVLVRTTGLTSARVARCRSDVGFFYIRHRGWFFWVWVVLKVLVVLVRTTGLVQGSLVVVPMWVSFTSATEDGSSGFEFWVWVPRCRGGGLLVLVQGDWPSERVARCRSDVGFF